MIVPENLEPPQLLDLLGTERAHPSPKNHPTHTLPLIFACEVNKGVVTFIQLPWPVAKKNLLSDKCYLLSYKDMVCLHHSVVNSSSAAYKIVEFIFRSQYLSLFFFCLAAVCKARQKMES